MNYKWTALTVTVVGTLMAGIDSRIVIIGLPTIASQLHAGAEAVIWITQVYVLACTVGLLLVGRISDIFGRIKMYNIAFMIFTAGSALSAFAANAPQLIAFRAIQGVGAGILVTNASTIVTDASTKKELGTMLGINQTAFRVGQVAGLTLSGLILTVVNWRGLFWVNIPIGIFGTIWGYKRLREIAAKDPIKKIDWTGFVLFLVGFTLILLAVTFLSYGLSGTVEGFSFLIVGIALLALFIKSETRISFPLLDLQLFKIKQFAMANISQALNAVTWGGLALLLSFYLQIGQGYTPLQAGIAILPLDVTYVVSSLIGGKLSDKHGIRMLTTVGLSMNAACFFVMATFGQATLYVEVALVLAFLGIGNGLFTPPNLRAIMGSVPPTRIGIASAFRNTMFYMGLAVSYGLVILFITFGIPYNAFSTLLQNTGVHVSSSVATLEFFNGYRIASLIMAIIGVIAIIPAAMRGMDDSGIRQKVSETDLAAAME